jgi:hypothetical protein
MDKAYKHKRHPHYIYKDNSCLYCPYSGSYSPQSPANVNVQAEYQTQYGQQNISVHRFLFWFTNLMNLAHIRRVKNNTTVLKNGGIADDLP